MAVLSIGQVWGAEQTVSWNASNGALGSAISSVNGTAQGTISTGSFSWNYTRTLKVLKSGKSDYVGMSGSYMQLGSSNAGEDVEFRTSNIPGTIKSVTVLAGSKDTRHTGTITVGGTDYNAGAISAWASSAGDNWEGTGTSSGEIVISISCNSKQAPIYIASITVVYEEGSTPTCATPTFSPAAGAVLSGTEVSISCATEGATIHYTTDGSDPTGTSATTQPISITSATTIKAIAVKEGSNNSAIATAAYTVVTPLTSMQAIFEAATSTSTPTYITFSNTWVVTGVSTNGKNAYITDGTKGMILFNSSATSESPVGGLTVGNTLSGTVQRSLKLYNGAAELEGFTTEGLTKGTADLPAVQELDAAGIEALNGANTGSLIKISGACTLESSKYYVAGVQLYNSLFAYTNPTAGNNYNVTGVYVQYNSTKEVLPRSASDIEMSSSVVAVTGVDLTESSASVEVGETVTLHASVVPGTATDKDIVWSVTSGSDKASVANGVVTGLAAGEAVIRAASHEDESIYDECTVTVTAADPTKHVVTFDATVDMGESPLSKSNITLICTSGVLSNGSEYRLYKNSTTTFACSDGNITKIEFTGVSGNPVSGFEDPEVGTLVTNGNDGVWTGNAASVSFVASGAQVRATEIKVTYKEDSRADAGLAYAVAAIDKTVGDAAFINPLTNTNSVAVTYGTSDDQVAEVANDGTVTITGVGSATITASFTGDETYKPASVSFTITVSAAALTDYYEKVTETSGIVEGTYLIVYEDESVAFNGGLETLDAKNNYIEVVITNENKIGVTSATEAATFYIDPAAGTIQAANGKYIGVTSNSNGLKQSDNADAYENAFEIDGDDNAVISAVFESANMTMRYNKASDQKRFRYFGSGQQPIALYKLANEVIKPEAGLAWDPATDIEITVGDALPGRTLLNPNSIDAAEITIASSNTDVATVDAGVVSLVADATGTTTITATFAGNASYKPATVSYKIKVNPVSSIYVSPSLNVNFSSVVKDAALPTDQKITVTLNNVAAATATLGGTNPDAFSVDKTALTESGDITISVVSSATVGEFKATLTISDDASVAASKEVKLSFTVTDPASEETPISTSTEWVAATEIADGMQVLITGVKDEVVYAMGEQKSTNRAAYVATLNEGVLTPGEGTMAFTLVAQGDGTYAIRTSNGKYLYAAASGSNHLKTQDEVDVNAKWTLTVASAVAEGSSNRNVMQFNGSGTNKLFACYATANQSAIQFYVPKPVTPPTPTPDYTRGVTNGNYGTICLPKAGVISGAKLFEIAYKGDGLIYCDEILSGEMEAGVPYIFQATADQLTVTYSNDNAPVAASNANGLYGFYDLENMATDEAAHKDLTQDAGNYILYQNQYWLVSGRAAFIYNFRAYIKLDEISTTAPDPVPGAAPRRRVAMTVNGTNTATGIDEITNEQSQMTNKVIIDGRLFIIRGEKMYNANGQLVK